MLKRSGVRAALGVFAALAAAAGAWLGGQRSAGAEGSALGPLREVALIQDFTRESGKTWKPRAGSNVTYALRSGYELPGVATSLMRVTVGRKNLGDRDPSHNWFTISRADLPSGIVPAEVDGFRFLLGSHTETQWWIQVQLTTEGGEAYSHILADHAFPAGRIVEYTVPLAEFRSSGGEVLTAEKARALRGVSFITSSPGATLYLDRISAYRRDRLRAWLDFTTSHPSNNLFQRTDPVSLIFTPGGALPQGAAGFRYAIRDYFGKVTARGTVRLTGARSYTVRATPKVHGYYEVTALFVDQAGRDLGKHSCIRAEGTVPAGLGTFSVLPGTIAENTARSRRLGARAFFGLHGDFLGLADAVGLTWRFEYTGWRYLEPEKPDRSSGTAVWARERLAGPPAPRHQLHILPFRANLSGEAPEWARSRSPRPPAFSDWEDYLAMVRDSARVEKHRYPHQKPRIYGGAWEVNLNMPPYVSQPPEHTPEDVAELFRRTREVVKAEDPEALVIGPCPSVLDLEWFERVFRAGVLKYLDGIETHGYAEGVFSPEQNDYPGKLAKLKALVRRYAGRDLPIYCTEAGQPGILGAEVVHRSQARRMARAAVILKGEGVRVFLPFYGIDYDRQGYWGFLFNLDVDSPSGPWATTRTSPKPMVNAIAACVRVLEGAAPTRRLRTLGKDVWAYVFDRQGTPITAVWTVGKPRTVRLPVGRARSVEVVNLLGHSRRVAASGGAVRLRIDDAPQYVIGAGEAERRAPKR